MGLEESTEQFSKSELQVALILVLFFVSSPVFAQGLPQGDGVSLVKGWIKAVVSGDKERVAAILAPEFQIMRGSGAHYDVDAYLEKGLPKIEKSPKFTALEFTESDRSLVATYILLIDAKDADGNTLTARAPRLTVFRKIRKTWYVTAHANFARIEE